MEKTKLVRNNVRVVLTWEYTLSYSMIIRAVKVIITILAKESVNKNRPIMRIHVP